MNFYLWTLIIIFYLTFQDGITFNDKIQMKKGLQWIFRHPQMNKGVVSNEMVWGAKNKHRSGDFQMG